MQAVLVMKSFILMEVVLTLDIKPCSLVVRVNINI